MDGRTDTAGVTYVDNVPATDRHPRNDSASIVQLDDGSLATRLACRRRRAGA